MNVVGSTFSVPVWYDATRIYVPTVDIPIGQWTLILTLTPIQNEPLGPGPDAHTITDVQIDPSPTTDKLTVEFSRSWREGKSWTLFFANRMIPATTNDRVTPIPIQYSIYVNGFPSAVGKKGARGVKLATRRFDPVVVAVPDPIYP